MQGAHQPRRGDMMEDGIAMRDEWKFHAIAGAEGIQLFLILRHFLADLFEILFVRRTCFFYFITHNKGFITTSIKIKHGSSVRIERIA